MRDNGGSLDILHTVMREYAGRIMVKSLQCKGLEENMRNMRIVRKRTERGKGK